MAKAGITKGGGSPVQKGPRGGTFYINAHGNKEYGTPPAGHPGVTAHKQSAADRLGLGTVGSAFRVSVPKGGSKAPQKPAPAPTPKAPAPKPAPAPKTPAVVKPPPAPPAPKVPPPAPKPAPVPPKPETKVKPPEPPPAPKTPPVGNTPGRPPHGLPPGVSFQTYGQKLTHSEAIIRSFLVDGHDGPASMTLAQQEVHFTSAFKKMRLDPNLLKDHPVNIGFADHLRDRAGGIHATRPLLPPKESGSTILISTSRHADIIPPGNSWSYKPPTSHGTPAAQVTIAHEMGHHIHHILETYAGGVHVPVSRTQQAAARNLTAEVSNAHRDIMAFNRVPDGPRKDLVSPYSATDHKEFFAEHWTAYHHEPERHRKEYPREHAMITDVRTYLGMEP